ncbi:hypothetical protein NJC40_19725 [Pseudomonas sp. 21LCFQ02]|uniref:DUF6708 domain-containing protein n=1 Tax=Pseudomonas sp. 21LCFQ02 TaxID=2957505 RepID=UPI00209A865F|nr:DUF6708 domain-containing protein [Pseudomonas sp. 21LCFQ02]MCO8169998.1 hypothetical protein [Pseudomonas sp. 21LCFQ02]
MTFPEAGTCKKTVFRRSDYLAPLPIPTGQKPGDSLGIIWRKNDTYMDIGSFTLSATIRLAWFQLLLFLGMGSLLKYLNIDTYWMIWAAGLVGLCIALYFIAPALRRPSPNPVRFNRHRREACVVRENGDYWFVPWEQVVAVATQASSMSQGGKVTQGMLYIGLNNPLTVKKDNQNYLLGFYCGGGEPAMALWECIRTYMEVGPDAVVSIGTSRFTRTKGIFASYLNDLKEAAKRKGWFLTLLWDGFFGLFVFNVLLADYLERKKLYPLPDLDHPDIIEWSKPLPPEQWARASAEFQAALAEYEARRVP